jgi:tRNA dimethylallyltransferase
VGDGSRPAVAALVGPTASGKTALALAIARRLPVEAIACDSQTVYRGLAIGTAKPTAAERAALPHHLLDVADPADDFSAARFAGLADRAIADVAARGKLPLLVGGSGLYLRAVLEGVFAAPPKDPALRAALERHAADVGPAAIHAELAAVDPETAARLPPNDLVRIVRALEVERLTGKPLSWHHARDRGRPPRYRAMVLAIAPRRDELERRVRARAEAMFDEGLVEEAVRIAAAPRARARLERLMGYREALLLAGGAIDRAEAIRRTALEQRRYAKRQLTWFRAIPGVAWLPWPPDPVVAGDTLARFFGVVPAGG